MALKIPSRRIASDDCIVHVGRQIDLESKQITNEGTSYAVHEGEWIEVLPIGSIRKYLALMQLSQSVQDQDPATLESALDRLCHEVAERVLDWNWTGMDGQLLPKPYRNTEVMRGLCEDELIWLAMATQGESVGEKKSDMTPSQGISSARGRKLKKG